MKVKFSSDQPVEIDPPDSDQLLGDYIDFVNEKLSDVSRFIFSAEIDGEKITEERCEQKCSSFEELKLEVRTFEVMTIDTVGRLGAYCREYLAKLPQVIDEWEENSDDEKNALRRQVLEAINLAGKVLDSIDNFLDVAVEENDKMKSRTEKFAGQLRESGREELKTLLAEQGSDYFSELFEYLRAVLDQVDEQKDKESRQLSHLGEQLDELHEELTSLIDKFQGGDVVDAYDELTDWAREIDELLAVIGGLDETGFLKRNLKPGNQEELEQAHVELYQGLNELMQAVEDRDPIMVCDILEYEFLPYLESLQKLFGVDDEEP